MPPELTAQLAPDEKVLWSGQPHPAVYILRGLPNLAYGITWSVLGAFWYHGSGGVGQMSAFEGWWRILPLFSIPFILAGFSFWFYPLRLGPLARRTWYVVTNRRVFIAELPQGKPLQLRVFAPEEMAAPEIIPRWTGLQDVILTRQAQENPHLQPRLNAGFFGLLRGEMAAQAIKTAMKP
jgi:hypothetical protein